MANLEALRAEYETAKAAKDHDRAKAAWSALEADTPKRKVNMQFASRAGQRQARERRAHLRWGK